MRMILTCSTRGSSMGAPRLIYLTSVVMSDEALELLRAAQRVVDAVVTSAPNVRATSVKLESSAALIVQRT